MACCQHVLTLMIFGLNMCMLEIYLSNTKVQRYPSIKIFVDDDLMEELQLERKQQCVKIPLSQADGKHTLTIEHFGKTNKDIVVKDNKIMQDTTFTVEKIVLDGIPLNEDILLECEFVPNWNDMEKPINLDGSCPSFFVLTNKPKSRRFSGHLSGRFAGFVASSLKSLS